jgi:hypothetical protein
MCKLVVERPGEWMTVDEYRALDQQRFEDDARSGAWLTRALDARNPNWRDNL